MGRTNIDVDNALVAEVMRRFNVTTKNDAVHPALQRLVGPPLTREFLLCLEGIVWNDDLGEVRGDDAIVDSG